MIPFERAYFCASSVKPLQVMTISFVRLGVLDHRAEIADDIEFDLLAGDVEVLAFNDHAPRLTGDLHRHVDLVLDLRLAGKLHVVDDGVLVFERFENERRKLLVPRARLRRPNLVIFVVELIVPRCFPSQFSSSEMCALHRTTPL